MERAEITECLDLNILDHGLHDAWCEIDLQGSLAAGTVGGKADRKQASGNAGTGHQ